MHNHVHGIYDDSHPRAFNFRVSQEVLYEKGVIWERERSGIKKYGKPCTTKCSIIVKLVSGKRGITNPLKDGIKMDLDYFLFLAIRIFIYKKIF